MNLERKKPEQTYFSFGMKNMKKKNGEDITFSVPI